MADQQIRSSHLRTPSPTLDPDEAFLARLSTLAAAGTSPARLPTPPTTWRVALAAASVAIVMGGAAWATGLSPSEDSGPAPAVPWPPSPTKAPQTPPTPDREPRSKATPASSPGSRSETGTHPADAPQTEQPAPYTPTGTPSAIEDLFTGEGNLRGNGRAKGHAYGHHKGDRPGRGHDNHRGRGPGAGPPAHHAVGDADPDHTEDELVLGQGD